MVTVFKITISPNFQLASLLWYIPLARGGKEILP